jgi:hypothetical protein
MTHRVSQLIAEFPFDKRGSSISIREFNIIPLSQGNHWDSSLNARDEPITASPAAIFIRSHLRPILARLNLIVEDPEFMNALQCNPYIASTADMLGRKNSL